MKARGGPVPQRRYSSNTETQTCLSATAALRAGSPSALRCAIRGRCHPTGSLSPDGVADTERGHEGVRALLSGSHRKVDERAVPRGDSAPGGGCRRAAPAPPRPPPAVVPFARSLRCVPPRQRTSVLISMTSAAPFYGVPRGLRRLPGFGRRSAGRRPPRGEGRSQTNGVWRRFAVRTDESQCNVLNYCHICFILRKWKFTLEDRVIRKYTISRIIRIFSLEIQLGLCQFLKWAVTGTI